MTETEIEQVFLNLFRNAAQAMAAKAYPEGSGPEMTVRALRQGDGVRVEVEDNGPGMEEGVRKRVLEPFFTTKPPGLGTGLGLSVSYFIVTQNHGGGMRVEATPGVGAKCVVTLPGS